VTPNIELLDQAIAWAEWSENDSIAREDTLRWNQAHFMEEADCGTTCCIAGWVALHEGYKTIPRAGGGVDGLEVVDARGNRHDISQVARKALGLTAGTANYLFWGSNTVTDLKRMRDNLAAGRDITDGFGYSEETE
jgi:hypothetical protein